MFFCVLVFQQPDLSIWKSNPQENLIEGLETGRDFTYINSTDNLNNFWSIKYFG